MWPYLTAIGLLAHFRIAGASIGTATLALWISVFREYEFKSVDTCL